MTMTMTAALTLAGRVRRALERSADRLTAFAACVCRTSTAGADRRNTLKGTALVTHRNLGVRAEARLRAAAAAAAAALCMVRAEGDAIVVRLSG
jgi:hypothetical protein